MASRALLYGSNPESLYDSNPKSKKKVLSSLVLSAFVLSSAAALAALSFCAVRLYQQVARRESLKELAQSIALVTLCSMTLLSLVITVALHGRRSTEKPFMKKLPGADVDAPNVESTQAVNVESHSDLEAAEEVVSTPNVESTQAVNVESHSDLEAAEEVVSTPSSLVVPSATMEREAHLQM
ncbi:hypothetical protein [Neorickettsia findlayensis]|uniref:Uncharacterized protein n=1 Tax=Neorickettsia findlayensis TaxID=2686014 RepID=A0A6P1G9I0_9RICK|nr:hypothetical protein [Neorickettsia findlayensis]QHD64958.1 hypothetical protein GP480_00530 [Neorickettsia findlayensis]